MELFEGFEGQHGTHGEPNLDDNGLKWAIKKTARTLKQPVTVEMWQKHIDGKRPLGIVPIRTDSTCLWGSIDIDQYDIDLTAVVRRVEELNLPFVPCRSKSGGLHLFMFFAEPIDAVDVQGLLRDLAASLGFAGSEIFPKQTKILLEQGDQGNWMVMPYYGGDFGGKLKMQHGLKKSGAEMTIGEFLSLAEKRKVTQDQIVELVKAKTTAPTAAKTNGKTNGKGPSVPYGDGPPCLQHLAASGFPEGGRNNALFHIGVYLKKAHPTDWPKHLEHDNQAYMKPPLPADEVDEVKKSLKKKEYEYKCKDQPMQSHCNSMQCRGRKHGVGVGGSYPEITRLGKLMTEPPLWFVTIAGHAEPLVMSTKDLQDYKKFHEICMAQANTCYRTLTPALWYSIVGEAMQNIDPIPAPADLSTTHVFLEMLETFLTNRMRGKTKEDILRGAPWEDEETGRHYFQLRDLEKFLQREGFKYDNNERARLKIRLVDKLKGGHHDMMIKGKHRYVWWVSTSAVTEAPELDIPELPRESL